MQRSVDGPDKVWSSVTEAAAWLGLTETEFRKEVKAHPDLLPFTRIGKGHKWHWMDLVAYAHYRRRPAAGELPEDE